MRTKYRATWSGPLKTDELPQHSIQRIRMQCRHDLKGDREQQVSKALAQVMGAGRVTHHGLRRYLTWRKSRWNVAARVTRRRIHVRATTLKASQLKALVGALAGLDGARDMAVAGRMKPPNLGHE